jgi:AsmA protein
VVDLSAETLALSGMKLTSGELVVSGALQGEKIQSAPSFSGDLKVAEFSLRNWMQKMGLAVPVTADPKVLNRVALDVHLKSSPKQVALEKLVMTLDDTRLDGVVRLQPLDKPGVRFDLAVDAIDLDRYLPPPAEGEAAQAKKAGKGEQPSVELFPVETLRQLDVAGVFRLGKLIVKKLVAQDIQLSVKAKDGRIKLKEDVKAFYQGAIRGSIGVDVRGADPKLKVEQHMKNIQAGPLLADLTGKDTLTGQGGFNASITARGQTPEALTKTLGGKLDFKFTDGALKGFNLAKTIRDTKARFKGKTVPPSDEPEQTDFSELRGSAKITKGVLVNKDLFAKSPLLRIEGAGKVNLPAESLDYTLTPVIVGTLKGQSGDELEDLKGIPVPVRFTGSLAKPEYSIDWKKVLVGTQKAKAQKKLDKEIDERLEGKVPDSLRDQLKDTLKGFF